MIELVISGGQTGADQAGWRAARAAGVRTGGWMPCGFKAEDGCHPEFAERYGARESPADDYPTRTRANYSHADGVILFGNPLSPGSKLLRNINRADDVFKPLWLASNPADEPTPEQMAVYLPKYQVRTLMVAGNRESSAPGIGAWVEAYMAEVFRLLREGGRSRLNGSSSDPATP